MNTRPPWLPPPDPLDQARDRYARRRRIRAQLQRRRDAGLRARHRRKLAHHNDDEETST